MLLSPATATAVPEPGAVLAASTQNLWYMRQFYHEYSAAPKLQPLVREISWAKNRVIIGRGKKKTVVEHALRTATRPLGVATYTVVPHQPEDYTKCATNVAVS